MIITHILQALVRAKLETTTTPKTSNGDVESPTPNLQGHDVRSYYQQGKTSQAYGTFVKLWGGWVSAYHVYKQQNYEIPVFAKKPVVVGMPSIDVVLYGCDMSQETRPRNPVEGEDIYLFGYPANTGEVSYRVATVYLQRSQTANVQGNGFTTPTWIGRINQIPEGIDGEGNAHIPYAQVSVGMSGGLVCAVDGEALGILVMQTSPMDSDKDGINEQYFDFVSLRDTYDLLTSDTPNIS